MLVSIEVSTPSKSSAVWLCDADVAAWSPSVAHCFNPIPCSKNFNSSSMDRAFDCYRTRKNMFLSPSYSLSAAPRKTEASNDKFEGATVLDPLTGHHGKQKLMCREHVGLAQFQDTTHSPLQHWTLHLCNLADVSNETGKSERDALVM